MQLQENICAVAFVMVAEYVLVLVAALLDLKSGKRKAKQRGEKITSDGLRRTVKKLSGYYNLLLCISVIDIMQMIGFYYLDVYYDWSVPLFPMLTLFGSLSFGFIEGKSIYEKAEDKIKKQATQAAVMLANAIENSGNPKAVADEVIKYLNKEEK